MRSRNAQIGLLATLTLLLATCWVIVIAVAIHVSQIVLNSLEMIIELAGITP